MMFQLKKVVEKNQKFPMKNELKQINNAHFAKRVLAVIMDAAVTLFVMFGFMILMFVPIADKAMHYSAKVAQRLQYQVASSLFVYYEEADNGDIQVYNLKDLDKITSNTSYCLISDLESDDSFYLDHVRYYFLHYKTGEGIEYPAEGNPDDFRAPNYQDLIDGKSPKEIYTYEWWEAKVNELKTKDAIMEYAFNDMAGQDYYIKSNKDIKSVQLFIILPPFALSFSIFFIVIPLCFKNGETLGKKTVHIALINKDGYSVQKRQIVLRQVLLLLYVGLSSFIIGVGLTSFATLGVGVLIYFVAAFIPKSHRSIVDFAAYTLEVDAKTSVWFKDALEETAKDIEIEDNIEKYKKNKVENKNVIQVGSTIVNEDVKREIEEEKKQHKNK